MTKLKGLNVAIRQVCDADRRSYRKIAEDAGISNSVLSTWFTGKRDPSIDGLDRLLESLGLSLEDLGKALRESQNPGLAPRAGSPDIEALAQEMGDSVRAFFSGLADSVRPPGPSSDLPGNVRRAVDRIEGAQETAKPKRSKR